MSITKLGECQHAHFCALWKCVFLYTRQQFSPSASEDDANVFSSYSRLFVLLQKHMLELVCMFCFIMTLPFHYAYAYYCILLCVSMCSGWVSSVYILCVNRRYSQKVCNSIYYWYNFSFILSQSSSFRAFWNVSLLKAQVAFHSSFFHELHVSIKTCNIHKFYFSTTQ